MNQQKIIVQKIVRKLDYFTKCQICGRQLKNTLETNIGTLGFDCFCRSIGIPYTAKQKVLPKEVYESLAITIVDQLNNTPIEVFGKSNLYFHFYDQTLLEFPIRYINKFNIRIYPANQSDQGKWINLSLITRLTDFLCLQGIDTVIAQEVVKTQVIQDWFYLEQGKCKDNLLGKTLEEMNFKEVN